MSEIHLLPRAPRDRAAGASFPGDLGVLPGEPRRHDEENETDIRCVGAAIYDHTDRVMGGVSLSWLAFSNPSRPVPELGARVVAAAGAISARLGAPSHAG